MENMMINEEMLGAYIEGSLSPQEMMLVEQELLQDSELQSLVDDVYGLDIVPITTEDLGVDIDSIELPEILAITEEPAMALDMVENSGEIAPTGEIAEEIIEEVDLSDDIISEMPCDDTDDWSQWNPEQGNPSDDELLLL